MRMRINRSAYPVVSFPDPRSEHGVPGTVLGTRHFFAVPGTYNNIVVSLHNAILLFRSEHFGFRLFKTVGSLS